MVPRSVWLDQPLDFVVPLSMSPEEEKDVTALVMHTSGSTGMPKVLLHRYHIRFDQLIHNASRYTIRIEYGLRPYLVFPEDPRLQRPLSSM